MFNRGEIATTLTILTLVVLTAGIFAGTQLSQQNTDVGTQAQTTSCVTSVKLISKSSNAYNCEFAASTPGTTFVCALIQPNAGPGGTDILIAGQDPNNWQGVWSGNSARVPLFIKPGQSVQGGSSYRVVAYNWKNPDKSCLSELDYSGSAINNLPAGSATWPGGGGSNPGYTPPPPTNTPLPAQATNTPIPNQATNTPPPATNTPTPSPTPDATKTVCEQSPQNGLCLPTNNCNDVLGSGYKLSSSDLGCKAKKGGNFNCCIPEATPTPSPTPSSASCSKSSTFCSECQDKNGFCLNVATGGGSCWICEEPTPTPKPTSTVFLPLINNNTSVSTSCGIRAEKLDGGWIRFYFNDKPTTLVKIQTDAQRDLTQRAITLHCPGVSLNDLIN